MLYWIFINLLAEASVGGILGTSIFIRKSLFWCASQPRETFSATTTSSFFLCPFAIYWTYCWKPKKYFNSNPYAKKLNVKFLTLINFAWKFSTVLSLLFFTEIPKLIVCPGTYPPTGIRAVISNESDAQQPKKVFDSMIFSSLTETGS